MRNPGHELASQRGQFGLDVANPAVQEFLFTSHDIVEALGEPVFVKLPVAESRARRYRRLGSIAKPAAVEHKEFDAEIRAGRLVGESVDQMKSV